MEARIFTLQTAADDVTVSSAAEKIDHDAA
jgi:hypothetical protein